MNNRLTGKYEVNQENGCWEWIAGTQGGYGRLRVGLKLVLAHRYSYQLRYGVIPSNMLICHKCDNPKCINPDHLFLGTPTDNARDKERKGRHVLSMLDTPEAVKVRAAWENNPGVSQREIARICDVSPVTAGKYKPEKVSKL